MPETTRTVARRLSKSRILSGLQCPKRLWLEVNRPELRVWSADTERRFASGHRLNEVVHSLFPDGILIGEGGDLSEALRTTGYLLRRHPDRPLFEATFSQRNVLVRADVMVPGPSGYRMVEVKSSTGVKDYHLTDCAVQAFVIEAAGVPVTDIRLAHVDNGFVYLGNASYEGLIKEADVNAEVRALVPEVPAWIGRCQKALAGGKPAIDVGAHCYDPFDCPFLEYCLPPQPEYPVTLLPRGQAVADGLMADGISDIRGIPDGRLENPLYERIRQATLSGEPFIDRALVTTLRGLPYPRYYLDFETIQFIIPIWPNTRPYEQLPFQWSCHIEEKGGKLTQQEFLDISGTSPMRACAERLITSLSSEGPVLVYSGFEGRALRDLANRFHDLAPELKAIEDRLFDLLPWLRAHYYHPAMKGSWSIKAVLPTVAPHLDYGALDEVRDGTAAQIAFEEAINNASSDQRRQQLRKAMLEYCRLDTLAMVELVRFFAKG